MALDERTDIQDAAQLAIFIRGITSNFEVMEKLVKLEPIMATTTCQYILDGFLRSIMEMNLDLNS